MSYLFNERGMTSLIDLVREWNRGDTGPDKAMSFIADLLTDTFGSGVLDDPLQSTPDCNGEPIRVGDTVIVPHPAGPFRGKVTRVFPATDRRPGSVHVDAPGYIRGNGRLGFDARVLTLVVDDGRPVGDWFVTPNVGAPPPSTVQ